jgi:hypothetical protein
MSFVPRMGLLALNRFCQHPVFGVLQGGNGNKNWSIWSFREGWWEETLVSLSEVAHVPSRPRKTTLRELPSTKDTVSGITVDERQRFGNYRGRKATFRELSTLVSLSEVGYETPFGTHRPRLFAAPKLTDVYRITSMST